MSKLPENVGMTGQETHKTMSCFGENEFVPDGLQTEVTTRLSRRVREKQYSIELK